MVNALITLIGTAANVNQIIHEPTARQGLMILLESPVRTMGPARMRSTGTHVLVSRVSLVPNVKWK